MSFSFLPVTFHPPSGGGGGGGGGGDLTAAQIKALYESNANTNAYTDADKGKLTELPTAEELVGALGGKVDKVAGSTLMTAAQATKLAGIDTGATKNATDAQLRDRTTHTGEQPISSVTGLESALAERVTVSDEKLTNAREWTAETISQTEAEARTATTRRAWTAQRVGQAIAAWWAATGTAFGRAVVSWADAAEARGTLGLGSRTISASGDGSWSVSFDGTANVTSTLTLANSGVAAGTYPKVTVDAKGRVTAGTALAATDIPALDWSKITTGKPTTIAGYGITNAQPLDATLTALAGVATAADRIIYFTGADAASAATLTAFGRSLIDDANASAALTTLGVSTFAKTLIDDADAATARSTLGAQGASTSLGAISSLTPAADRLPYFTSGSAAELATLSAFGRSLIDDADAAAARATLGLGTAATGTVTTSQTDDTEGRLLKVGDFGTGAFSLPKVLNANTILARGAYEYNYDTGSTGGPESFGTLIHIGTPGNGLRFGGWAAELFVSTRGSFHSRVSGVGTFAGQPWHVHYTSQNAALAALSALTPAADRLGYFTGAGTAELATLTAFARTLLDDADAATARTTLGVNKLESRTKATLPTAAANNGMMYLCTDAAGGAAPVISNGTAWLAIQTTPLA